MSASLCHADGCTTFSLATERCRVGEPRERVRRAPPRYTVARPAVCAGCLCVGDGRDAATLRAGRDTDLRREDLWVCGRRFYTVKGAIAASLVSAGGSSAARQHDILSRRYIETRVAFIAGSGPR